MLIGNCIELGDGELPHAPLAAILRQLEHELDPDALAAVLGSARAVLDPAAADNRAPGSSWCWRCSAGSASSRRP